MSIRRLSEGWGKANETFWRGVYLLGVFSFFLPFVSVKSCTYSDKVTSYTGIDLLRKDSAGWLYVIPITVALLLFGLSYLHRRQSPELKGFTRCWKALVAYVSGWIVVVLTGFTFLLDNVSAGIGQIVAGACWGLVYLSNVGGAIVSLRRARRGPPLGLSKMTGWLRAIERVNVLIMTATLLAVVGLLITGFLKAEYEFFAFSLVLLLIPVALGTYLAFLGLRYGERWAIFWTVAATLVFASAAEALLIITGAWSEEALPSVVVPWVEEALPSVVAAVFLGGLAGLLLGSLSGSRTEHAQWHEGWSRRSWHRADS